MAGCSWRRGMSLAEAGLIAATLDNVTNPRPASRSEIEKSIPAVGLAVVHYEGRFLF